jgi:hypothetical protein
LEDWKKANEQGETDVMITPSGIDSVLRVDEDHLAARHLAFAKISSNDY